MDEAEALRRQTNEGWGVVEDAGRGWRRVVPSPLPTRVVELDAIGKLIDDGVVVITVGGGGIPVVADDQGHFRGVSAVVDKDYASGLLATSINAELLLISTSVEKVALHFGIPEQEWVDHMTISEATAYLEEGVHFKKGSMAPKIQAAIWFLEQGGKEVIITNPENIERALAGETGTRITPD
jgi:carbamate kinase